MTTTAGHRARNVPERASLVALLTATAVLYLWNLSASGWGNSFYAAAAQAGAKSWKAWLFGSLDAGNAITVDKPPAAMWVMGLSARIFGVNSWAILAPQALMGVASVFLLYLAVKRWFGHGAGLLAGAALALTPVAVLMFRYDNPDALLVLLMTAAAYTTVRATEVASGKSLAWTGVLLGFGFLTKMMQAFLVLPAMALVYLVAAPAPLGRRFRHLSLAGLALVASAGWFVALVSLWPASSRPYIAGSTNNTLWELALGYNGLGRILGGAGNGGGGGGGGGNVGFGGATGIGRLFGTSMGTEISWLLPAALIALVTVLAATWTAPRTDRARAAMLLWGGWLLVTGVTFSYMSGTIHPYYTIALAPSIAAVTGIGARVLWLYRTRLWGRIVLAAMVLATAAWGFVLLGRTDWLPALRWAAVVAGVVAAAGLIVPAVALRRLAVIGIVAGLLSAGLGSAAYATATVGVAHTGSIPSSGPSGSSGMGGGPGGGGFGRTGDGAPPAGNAPAQPSPSASSSTASASPSAPFPGGGGMGRGGGADTELTALLKASTTTWSAAVSGATSAADLELASGTSVIALGGWNGSDPSPTLAEFQTYVKSGRIHYYIAGGVGGGGGMGGGSTDSSQIASWVTANYPATTVGGSTVYDLS
ncbi:glycosyl transferase [Actinoplanes sp. SE50]|uniref:glycosyltransferase family 39 protein n=1 Tax=unclassified Actinoplanes TaxID=2626549 RepID=UPI00023ED211|nr:MULTISPECIES: glycosyltransferase family 39 protein [unclassified Actinoplanes]AEV83874.1 glycosyl transferase family 39 [Actinoplanes sp. SE50/110]ATO81982.1 glycosyl transferase [Actinoplanes sp. SE50]SLL99390.1 glycosyl transferase [Actinoplanes sp. SE50/110]